MRPPSYRRHSSGQARVTIAGKDYLLGPYGSKESRRKYNKLIAEYIASGQSPSFGVPSSELTISELVASYAKFARRYYGLGPSSDYLRCKPALSALKQLYGPENAIGYGPLQFKATRAHLQKVVVKTLKSGKKRKYVRSRRYINVLMKLIRRVFRWAASESMVPTSIHETLRTIDPLKAGRTDSPERERVAPIDQATVDATILHCSKVVADMVRFQMLVGCRPGEVCSIKPGMVDRSNDVWEINLTKHKTAWRGKHRTIYVGPKAQAILKPYLLRAADANCFSPKEATKQVLAKRHDNRVTPLSCGNVPGSSRKNRSRKNLPKPEKQPGTYYTTLRVTAAPFDMLRRKLSPLQRN
jgi:integrase